MSAYGRERSFTCFAIESTGVGILLCSAENKLLVHLSPAGILGGQFLNRCAVLNECLFLTVVIADSYTKR